MTINKTTILRRVFDELREEKLVYNQAELGKALELTKGYVSMLMNDSDTLPKNVQIKLHTKYNISTSWLLSHGTEGSMWPDGKSPKELGQDLNKNNKVIQSLLKLLEGERDLVKQLMTANAEQRQLIIELTAKLKK